jgi:hypothetical protein
VPRPDFEDFTAAAEQMSAWSDPCAILDPSPIANLFAGLKSVNKDGGEPYSGSVGLQSYECSAKPNLDRGYVTQAPYTVLHIFENNLDAFDRYYRLSVRYPQMFSDAEVDRLYERGDESSWKAVQITAQDTPTSASAQEVIAAAVMLGDFYVVEILIRFPPDESARTDCEPDSEDDCIMTAAYIADFLATSSYLEDLYASIEATFER